MLALRTLPSLVVGFDNIFKKELWYNFVAIRINSEEDGMVNVGVLAAFLFQHGLQKSHTNPGLHHPDVVGIRLEVEVGGANNDRPLCQRACYA
jgi:hypothetical protein